MEPSAWCAAEGPVVGESSTETCQTATARSSGGFRFSSEAVLAERYRVVGPIGRGAMGEVYEVEDVQLRERVALKTLALGTGNDPEALQRFRNEVKNARCVVHPNICRTFDLGVHEEAGGTVYFLTMELLKGEPFDKRLKRGALPEQELREVAKQTCSAMEAAHAAGVVHRDLKPSNLMLSANADGTLRVVVTDFGIAKRLGDATITREGCVGSPAYMAPEQVEGKKVGPAADLYALGVMLFEAATGQLPFEGATPFDVALQRLREAAPRPRQFAPALDESWDEAISRCLARDTKERFSSARELVAALEVPGSAAQALRGGRRPLYAAIAGALVALAGLATFLAVARLPAKVVARVEARQHFEGADAWVGRASRRLLERRLREDRRFAVAADDTVEANTVIDFEVQRTPEGKARVELSARRARLGLPVGRASATAPSVAEALDQLVPELREVLGHRRPPPAWSEAEVAEARRMGAASPESLALYRRVSTCFLESWDYEVRPCQALADTLVQQDPGWPRAWLAKCYISKEHKDYQLAFERTKASGDELGRRVLRRKAGEKVAGSVTDFDVADPLLAVEGASVLETQDAFEQIVFQAWKAHPELEFGHELLSYWTDPERRKALARDWLALAPESLERIAVFGDFRELELGLFLHGLRPALVLARTRRSLESGNFEQARGFASQMKWSSDPVLQSSMLQLTGDAAVFEGRFSDAVASYRRAVALSDSMRGNNVPVQAYESLLRLSLGLGEAEQATATREAFLQMLRISAYESGATEVLLEYEAASPKCPDRMPWEARLKGRQDEKPGLALLERAAELRGCSSCKAVLARGLQGQGAEYFDVGLYEFARCAVKEGELPLALTALDRISVPGVLDKWGPSPFHVVLAQFERARVLEAMSRGDEARASWERALLFWRHADRPRSEIKEARDALERLKAAGP